MKSLQDIIESVLSPDAGVSDIELQIQQILSPFCTTLKTCGTPNKRTNIPSNVWAVQNLIKKTTNQLDKLRVPEAKNPYNVLKAGGAVLGVSSYKGNIQSMHIYYMLDDRQWQYYVITPRDKNFVSVGLNRSYDRAIVVPNYEPRYIIPGWIVKDMFEKLLK